MRISFSARSTAPWVGLSGKPVNPVLWFIPVVLLRWLRRSFFPRPMMARLAFFPVNTPGTTDPADLPPAV